uniref:Uncharacterized protein n=2 Tax=Natrinema halophilum TaxID=1699371 RepID=A0A7D5GN26_9EURY
MTDGGQAEMDDADDGDSSDESPEETTEAEAEETESGEGEEAESEEAEGEAEEAESEEAEEEAEEAESEEAEEEAEEAESEEVEEEAEEAESEEAEEEAEEAEEEEAEEEAEEAEEEEAEEDEYHVEDADDVYQSDEASGVLHLDLDGLFLDLLGLEVNLNSVTLDVSARPGEGNLLGNLLSAVAGLMDGTDAMMDKAKSLLSKPVEFLSNLMSKPGEWLEGLFSGDGERDEEPTADEDVADEGEDESPGRIASAIGWLKKKLASLVPSVPTEEIVAIIVREVLEQLVERLEPDRDEESGGQPESQSQAEATS